MRLWRYLAVRPVGRAEHMAEAVVEDAKAQAVAELAEIGNVPKGTVSGYVAHSEDAYPQKPVEVRVKGRTVKNLWPAINGMWDGITVATDGTGLITVSGARDDGGDGTGSTVSIAAKIALIAGRTYAFSLSDANGTVDSSVKTGIMFFITGDGSPYWELSLGGRTSGTITVPAQATNITAYVGVTKTVSETVNVSFRVMLVEGTEAPDCFTPPASITSVKPGNLVTAGKNLIDASSMAINKAVDTETGNVYITSSSGNWYATETKIPCPPPGSSIVCSADRARSSSIAFYSGDGTFISGKIISKTQAVTVPYGASLMAIDVYKDYFANFQLELGSTATTYEPPDITTTPLPEVELRSLPNGTCDELVIGADGTCRVERKTQLVDGEVVALDTPTTEPQSSVTLPVLPAPTFNQCHDSDIPSDTSTTYTRDINIALADLEAAIASITEG